ncbi:sortase domain-containing protein [Irregularibacter muris]
MNKGDEIIIRTKEEDYKYKVYEKKIVDPYDFSVLASQGEEKSLP